MNRMWSVLIAPCLVATVVPSISGSRSRCTPSRETSAPPWCARRGGGARADERVQHPLFRGELRLRLDVFALAALDEPDGDLDQVAHDLLDIASDIADLGELGRLDLQEGRARELGEAA